MPDHVQNPVLGIDLGTTFSAIARWTGRGTEIYRMHGGQDELQSAIYCNPDTGEILIGQLAFRRGLIDPENLTIGFKRMMDDSSQRIKIGGKDFSPVDLSSKVLGELYYNVERKFPKNIFDSRGSVVTVPYYFKAHQCENTRTAAEQADIQCLGIIQEPIAASLTYAWKLVTDKPDEERKETMLVFDLGGGTFDLTLFDFHLTADRITYEVVATGGDDRLGGMDFDQCLAKKLLEKANLSLDGLNPKEERKARQKLLEQTITVKEILAYEKEYPVTVANILPDKHLEVTITRTEFEECIDEYIGKIREILRQLWITAKVQPSKVDRVILVGGSSKIPCMRELLIEVIGGDKIYEEISKSHAVAEGAALYAAYLDDPAVFGREIEITTRTCHALGVETEGGRFAVIIPANNKAPCQRTHKFANPRDNITAIDLNVYQGSSRMVEGNSKIGTIKIRNLPPRPARELDITVTFRVSADQKLSVRVQYEADDGNIADVQNVFTMQ